jgi:copper chaperone CopZ
MKTIKFKSSLKCSGCVSAIKPFMDSVPEIDSWSVDLNNPDKVIEIHTLKEYDNSLSDKISKGISKIGYTTEKI